MRKKINITFNIRRILYQKKQNKFKYNFERLKKIKKIAEKAKSSVNVVTGGIWCESFFSENLALKNVIFEPVTQFKKLKND